MALKPVTRAVALLLAIAAFLLAVPGASRAVEDYFRLSEAAIGKDLGGFTLIDQDNVPLNIRALAKKPVIINFIYTDCGHTCGTVTAALGKAINKTGLGPKFSVLTIGFDASKDTPSRMRAFGVNFTEDFENWKFASADPETIKNLTQEAGFFYKKNDSGFEHPNMLTVLSPGGKIFAHLYGTDVDPKKLMELVESSIGGQTALSPTRALGLLEKIKLLCYSYDPATGSYKPDYFFFMALAFGIVFQSLIVGMGIYIFRSIKMKN